MNRMTRTHPITASFLFLAAGASFTAAGRAELKGAFEADALAGAGLLVSLGFGLAAVAGALLVHGPVRQTLGLTRPHRGSPPIALLIAGQLGASIVASAALGMLGASEGSALEKIDQALRTAPSTVLPFLAVGIALGPGVAEEVFFRGLILGALLRRTGVKTALAISTALFAAAHFEPIHMAGAAVLGLYLAAVRVTTGSTLACILAHICNNAFAIFLSTQSWPAWSDALTLPLAAAIAVIATRSMLLYHYASVARPPDAG